MRNAIRELEFSMTELERQVKTKELPGDVKLIWEDGE